jgi:N-acetylneuraminic acid mutarotase
VWVPTSINGAPSPRELHTAVWTGSEMIVWGGYFYDVSDTLFDDGYRYDPATDSWSPTSTTGAATPRALHTAVWTGSRMVVWGGADFNGYPVTGGRYDPTTDTWAPMSTTAAPAGRQNHTVVWTGSRMIVWGGYFYDGADHELNSGGRYDPVADTWAATSTGSGVPSPRDLHAAVWTGSRMVVWGGYDAADLVNTGGRYDPTTNTWTTTSTANAPPGVELHTAVWTGTRMVVWGGWDGFEDVVTGGRYDPTANSWTATSTTGAPPIRDSHTAVWTGGRMVVWGGGLTEFDGVNFTFTALDTGGWYDPATDNWTSTATTGVPTARFYHTAVWTGTLMVVWGGEDTFQFLDTGGSYAVGSSVDADGDGYTGCAGDCNDSNPAVYPGASEVCNGIDDDCNTVIDDGDAALCDDADPCTTDTCAGVTGCAHVNDGASCTDANACTANSCDPASGCVYPSANLDVTGFSTARVDGRDLIVLADAWNSCPTDPAPSRYDAAANLDPTTPCIEDTDFHLFMTTFGQVCP